MKIFIAGASAELERARGAMNEVREIPALTLMLDWVASIDRYKSANLGLTEEVRAKVSEASLVAVRNADLFWLLMPNGPTAGAWVELGHFLGTHRGIIGAHVIVSGGDPQTSIFTAAAHRIFATDLEALAYLADRFTGRPRQSSLF